MKNNYIQAIIESLNSNSDIQKLLNGVKDVMHKKGHIRLYPTVLNGVLRILETKPGVVLATVVVAKETDLRLYTSEIKKALSNIGIKGNYITKIDETIIGGVIVKNENLAIDCSYKSMLTNLYRSATKIK